MAYKHLIIPAILGIFFLTVVSCVKTKEEKQMALYNTHCASCHIAPAMDALPKHLWKNKVLPEMAARMGIRDSTNDPYKGLSMQEQGAIINTGVYPSQPIIDLKDWDLLKSYILSMAPEKLPAIKQNGSNSVEKLTEFKSTIIPLDSANGSTINYLKFDSDQNRILTGTMRGALYQYDISTSTTALLGRAGSTITDYKTSNGSTYLTAIGFLLPSEIASGVLSIKEENGIKTLPKKLHRPVNTVIYDLNENGQDEIVISEFGDLKGKLSLWVKDNKSNYIEHDLLNQPGVIRVVPEDMNKDGKVDLVAITSQGDESIIILYQEDNLSFRAEKVIRFPPIYGSSWFELIDYDNDGDQDIVTVHGDNADETYIPKPYHGMRIHLNDGNNTFTEAYFYPMNGCTRVIAKDFDQDGDHDFALLSTFPDYKNLRDRTFVYLENNNLKDFDFQPKTLENPNAGRWFLMDSGDLDKDGDEDLILSSFTYDFSPIPDDLKQQWSEENTDIMLLENQLK